MENKHDFEDKIRILYKLNKDSFDKCINISQDKLAEKYKIKLDTIIEVCISLGIDYTKF